MKKIGNFKKFSTRMSGCAVSLVGVLTALASLPTARALDMDWSGDFRAENHWISNYRMNSANATTGGYSIPGSSSPAQFQTLLMRLKPRVIVNDNVYLHSEFWLGDPSNGFFGDSAATASSVSDRYNSTFSSGRGVVAQRYWAEVLTDVGNLNVGRAPLQWGLGLVWNSGDGLFDRFQSTGDVVQMVSKFGAFSFVPASVKYSNGGLLSGGASLADYAVALKYENADEDFEGGVNFIRRVGGGNSGYKDLAGNPGSINATTWDIFTRKKLGKVQVAAEAPIMSGKINETTVSTYALAVDGKYALSDAWNFAAKLGHVPGQSSDGSKFRGFLVHPNYKLGLILFNYQLANIAGDVSGAGASASVFDSPIFNTNYLQLAGDFTSGKWTFRGAWTYARALETAGTSGQYYNQNTKSFANVAGATTAQSAALGWELDGGATMNWDDHLQFKADAGMFVPGDFFKYTGTATENETGTVLALVLGVGAKF